MATAADDAKIDIGRTASRAFESFARQFLPYTGLALLLGAAPAFLTGYLSMATIEGLGSDFAASPIYWGIVLLSLVFGYLLQAALVRSMILDLSGRPADMAGSLVTALQLLPQMVGLTILSTVATAIGLVLLVVPGIIVYIALSVAVPVLVEERIGVIESMSRSAELTQGSRWRILGLLVMFAIFYFLITGAFGVAAFALGFGNMTLTLALNSLSTGFVSLIGSAMLASLYIELRTVKEGATADGLAEIFA